MSKMTVLALIVVIAAPHWLPSRVLADVAFDWVTIGNPGNATDPLNSGSIPGIGSVAYTYRIAQNEVTNRQYAEFLNAVAATDTNELYALNMGSDMRGGITQSGSSGNFTYAVRPNMGNKPVNFVSFFDAMRFVNWLHNGQPSGAQDASTTEDGVYAISDGLSETRAAGARFFIPTENEWYKAAYHQPSGQGGDTDDYWLYPTASNSVPTVAAANAAGDISNPGTNVANYDLGAVWNGQNGNVTTVGSAGTGSDSFYSTSDQGGNLWEWNDAVVFESLRVLRGGSWDNVGGSLMRSSHQDNNSPTIESVSIGFRVAAVLDCNNNGIPDECDLDCGATIGAGGELCSSVYAGCGLSMDENGNGVLDDCAPDIPTISGWGVVVMVVLLLGAGGAVLRRRVAA